MTYLLFPGRHLLQTTFQAGYLRQLLHRPLAALPWHGAPPAPGLEAIDQIVFAITSSNQANSRYNAIPFHVRAIGVDRFARELEASLPFQYRLIGVPHYRPTPRFADYVLKEIAAQTEGHLTLTPANSVILCSTPAVIAMYEALGFAILPAEMDTAVSTPIDVLRRFVDQGEAWAQDGQLRRDMAATTFDLWHDFPDIPRRILRLWRDPLLNDEGSLTDTRDYASYAYGMAKPGLIALKYADISAAILPGKIVDEGCADGALLAVVARDFPDSDLIGIEITGEFLARCRERQRAGDFGGNFVYFHQRNITQPIFDPNSIDTTICNSTVHELWSYGEREATVLAYLGLKYDQTAVGGRLIIRDVVGPRAGEREVYLWLNAADGVATGVDAAFADSAALKAHLDQLSTYGRFLRFARDFLRERRARGERGPETAVAYDLEMRDGQPYAIVTLRVAAEFISKMSYTDNWDSEMFEEFAFWDIDLWRTALRQAGFHVVDDSDDIAAGSRVYCNDWVVENRYKGRVALYTRTAENRLSPLPFPETNVVMIGEKRAGA